ncbi:MAG TPA: DUF6580 family putative transport protein [Chitinophagaceae bacterium]|jgi:hypothetical protein|nr:DUF6580 family putative transport protein [Chitinophagaceae bacterium]
MTNIKFDPRTVVLLVFISITAAIRVIFNFNYDISPLANFSPIGAMALFGGAYFNKKWKAFAFPLLMLFISDIILHQTVFKAYSKGLIYGEWYWVYGAFALMTLTGRWLLKKVTINRFLLSVLACVFIHWIVTDFGIWIGSKTWEQSLKGFLACLTVAIPYEWRFLAGTLVYGVVLFGLFEWMKRKYTVLRIAE